MTSTQTGHGTVSAAGTDTLGPRAAEPPTGVWPLGPTQRALWFLDTFHPGSSFYVICLGLRLRGDLDVSALRAALDDCVAHQDALRTRFVSLDGYPYQVFVPSQRMDLPLLDVSGLGPAAAEDFVQMRCDVAADTPFDLTADFPLRAELIRLADDHHVLVAGIHHIVFDGWSAQVLLTELAEAYAARAAGREPGFAPLELTVGEHAAQHGARFADGTAERAAEVEHWRQLLAGAQRVDLPLDQVRPEVRSFTGDTLARDIDSATTGALRALAGAHGTTVFTVLATAFSLVLAELSGQQDVMFGVPLAGRLSDESTAVIGFLVNVLPLRVDLGGTRTFAEALDRHRQPVLDLLTHQEFPFALLVDELRPERTGNRNPYFDVCFQYLPSPEVGLALGDVQLDLVDGRRPSSQFDLSCDVHDRGSFLTVALEYSTEVFAAETVELVHELIAAVLTAALADPYAPVRMAGPRTEPLRPAEPLAAQWRPGGLRELVAGWARLRPEAAAVVVGADRLDYAGLDAAATRLAARLIAAGVRPGDRVGLLVEPCAELPVAMLAVLECGAAYVPVDPRTPAERAAAMLGQAACGLLLVHPATRGKAAGLGCTLMDVTEDVAEGVTADTAAPAAVAPMSPAYVIFTSGSTGRPKAVAVQQSAALTLAASTAHIYELTGEERVLQMAAAAVDVSVEEFFGAWYAGACAVMHNPEAEDLEEVVRRQRATVLNLPASRWHEWTLDLTDRGADVPACVRLVVAGSERVDPARVRAWQSQPGRNTRLLNAYGTTEACVSSVWYDTARLDRDAAHTGNVPVGGPLPHVRLYVLDGAGEPVPPGVPGELHIAGPGVGLGYLDDGAATAERFLPDPYAPEPGGRMYRTGDRVRQLRSGALDFLGRTDTQVKVRGSRIDLAEVERTAAEVAAVADFVADVREDEHGAARLVGYLRPADSRDGSLEQDRVAQWRLIHDEDSYNEAAAQADFNTSGWISSYTQEPIPDADMREWLDETAARILRQPAGRVLEIGCGTGLVLLRVARGAERYVATDIAAGALAYVEGQLEAAGLDDGRVRLLEAAADDFTALGEERFDLVVINSVSQYFPDMAYLERVLTGAWERLRPGGRVFLGDVRDLTTLEAFHLSVRLARTDPATSSATAPAALADEVSELVDAESELCVAPGWFARFAERLPGAAAVTEVKRGRADTEMNRFRYDVSLWRDAPPAPPVEAAGHDGPVTLDGFRALIDGLDGGGLVLTGIPDVRNHRDMLLASRLKSGADVSTDVAPDALPREAVHPDDLVDAAAAGGYAAVVSPHGAGLLTVTVTPMGPDGTAPVVARAAEPVAVAGNQPLRAARNREAIAAVREHLARRLPSAMIPARFVVVDRIPLTISGKADRRRLPDPGRMPDTPGRMTARTDDERALCGIWAQALGLASVGVRDNFFRIGGDSITWLRIMSRCVRAGYPVGARDIFDHQTVEELARLLADRRHAAPRPESGNPGSDDDAERPDSAALNPIQHWFFEAFGQGRDHQNQYQWYELTVPCGTEEFVQAVRSVAVHHDSLLSTFTKGEDGWRQYRPQRPEAQSMPVREVDLTRVPEPGRNEVLRRESDLAQASLRITDGPLFAVVLFRTGEGEADLVFWCIHHLVVDAVSWQPLSEDLDTAIEALNAGGRPVLPQAVGDDAAAWAAWSRQEADRLSDDELAYWHSTASAPGLTLPVAHPDASPLAKDGHVLVRSVRLIQGPTRAGDAVLAACLAGAQPALAAAAGVDSGTVWLEFHGRPLTSDAPEVSRTVGWFTALFPFLLAADPAGAGIRGRLAAVPHGGIGYGRARYLRGERLDTAANVVVNYLGAMAPGEAKTLRAAPRYSRISGPVAAPDAVLPFAAEINIGLEEDGSLTVAAHLGARHFDAPAARAFVDELTAGIADRLGSGAEPPAEDGFELLPDSVRASAFAAELRDRPDVVAAYALAPVQRTMLYRHLLDPSGDVNYNDFVLALSGELDADLFRAAWRAVGERHEVLRTSFEWTRSSEPVQLVHRAVPEIRFLDWTGTADGDLAARLERLVRAERTDPPALDAGPPFRLTLVTVAPNRHHMVWLDHHILLDGWSSGILVRELTEAYAHLAAGREPYAGAEAPVRYRDYLGWLRQRPSGAASAYWRAALDGFEGPTALPFDAPPSASVAATGDFHESELVLDAGLPDALRTAAERHRTTAGSLCYAAWAAFLHRCSGRSLITFGIAQSGRPAGLGDVGAMVGMYMSTLPMAIRVDPDQRVADLFAQVSEQGWKIMSVAGSGSLWDVYDWAGIPVSRALFHSVVVVQNFGAALGGGVGRPPNAGRPQGAGLPLSAEMAPARTASGFPVTLAVDPDGGVLRLVADSRCLSPDTARQLLTAFAAVLRQAVTEPDTLVGELTAPPVSAGPTRTLPGAHGGEPPRGEIEGRIARAWCAELGVDRVGRSVNLFDAGATSLSAARLHARLCADFGRALPITDVFRYPTVASMAAALAPDGSSDASDAADSRVRTAERVSRNNRRREALRARPGRTGRRVSHEREDTDQ